jgi:hypothetical protein
MENQMAVVHITDKLMETAYEHLHRQGIEPIPGINVCMVFGRCEITPLLLKSHVIIMNGIDKCLKDLIQIYRIFMQLLV